MNPSLNSANTAAPLFQEALQAHHQGRLEQAHALYEQVSSLDSTHAEALHLRGVICLQWGQTETGMRLIAQALGLQPHNAKAHYNLANACLGQKRYDDALDHFDLALRHQPGYVQALVGQGKALLQSERPYSAMASFAQAIRLQPDLAEAHLQLVMAHAQLAQFDQAHGRLTQLQRQRPGQVAVQQLAAWLAQRQQVHTEHLRVLLGTQPSQASPAQLALAGVRASANRQFTQAIELFNASLARDPRQARVYNDKGLAHIGLGQYYGAIECFDHATALDPALSQAWHNAGTALSELHQYPAAIEQFKQAIRTSSDHADSLFMQLMAQLNICDWTEIDALTRQIAAQIKQGLCPMQPLQVLAISDDPVIQLQAAKAHFKSHAHALDARDFKPPQNARDRIRVAYFSGDFREHAVSYLTAELFELHHRDRFEVVAFNFGKKNGDPMQERLRRAFDQFHDVHHLQDEAIVELARSLRIDIAVDLAGYTADNRAGLFARRVAPVQINYLGFPGTLGHPQMDYLLGDPVVTPAQWHSSYSEKVISLPCFQVNDRQRQISQRVFTREELGIPADHFVFCCFNASYKITPAMFDTWLRILAASPRSSLLLVKDHDQTEANLVERAQRQGIARERLIFCTKVSPQDNLARYRVADLFLDSLPFNAGTTASDALWAGLPVLTCAGRAFAARMAASLLHAVGLPELVTHDLADYERLAIALAADPQQVQQLKARLAAHRDTCTLFDTPTFVKHLEHALVQAQQRHMQGLPPAAIDATRIEPAT